VQLYGNRGFAFEPGIQFEYSKYGFILLGVIVEKVSGQSYYDYVREHVYLPAGMTSTGSEPEDQSVSNLSIGYTANGTANGLRPNTGMLPYRGTSAGGGYSTVEYLLGFANAVQQNKLLNVHFTELLLGTDFPAGSINGIHCFGHSGCSIGMNGDLEICPVPGYVVIVLANMDPPIAGATSLFIASRLPEK